jgi:hypothetical protein
MLKKAYEKIVEENYMNESRADQLREQYDKLYQ